MALVSYDCSDSSDYEENDEPQNNGKVSEVTLIEKKDKIELKEGNNTGNIETDPIEEVKKSFLPSTEVKSNFNVVSWALLSSKNRTQPIRISVPSLDNEKGLEESKPKLKPSSTKSGLFAILPKPKQHLLAPSSLNLQKQLKKKDIKILKPVTILKNSVKSTAVVPAPAVVESSSLDSTADDPDEDEEQPKSFFFLPEEKVVEEPNNSDIDEILKKSDEFLKKSSSYEDNTSTSQEEHGTTSTQIENTYHQQEQLILSESQSDIELNKEALEKLCGSRGKRLAGDLEMVDVSGSELVGDSKLWLTKELTAQNLHFKRSKFDPLQKRKHQITYLAAHAREQELELSNQWAHNRMTKKQTQAKYGF